MSERPNYIKNNVNLKNMCVRCLRMLHEDEPRFGFRMKDSHGNERLFKGHEECMNEMAEILNQLYYTSEPESE